MKNLIFYLGIILIIISCSSIGLSRDEKIVNQITAKTAAKIEKEKDLYLFGTGGSMMDDIKSLHMAFQCFRELDIDEARDLLVYCVEEFLNAINTNEEVRPYLHNYPFTAKNISIEIYISKPDRTNIPRGSICIAESSAGKVVFYIRSKENNRLKIIRQETYEEAKELIDQKKYRVNYRPLL